MVSLPALKTFAVHYGLRLTFGQYAHAGQRHLSFGVKPCARLPKVFLCAFSETIKSSSNFVIFYGWLGLISSGASEDLSGHGSPAKEISARARVRRRAKPFVVKYLGMRPKRSAGRSFAPLGQNERPREKQSKTGPVKTAFEKILWTKPQKDVKYLTISTKGNVNVDKRKRKKAEILLECARRICDRELQFCQAFRKLFSGDRR